MSIEIAFPKADLGFLKTVASNVGIKVKDLDIPRDIRCGQELVNSGISIPGDLEPVEAYLLLEIVQKVEEGAIVPEDFIVYLNDRFDAKLPEADVPVVLARQRRVALNNLISAVDQVHSKLGERPDTVRE